MDIKEEVEKYKKVQPVYDSFTKKLHMLLEELFDSKGIDLVIMESRAKTVESFKGKIEREDKDYTDPLNEITDLSGIRIIAYYNSDVDEISNLIRKEFEIDEENSVDKRKIDEEDRFGYQSSHLVVSLSDSRKNLFEWSAFKGLRAEIQVRTVLQHSWAAIDHKLRYKTEELIPTYLKRKLYRLSALLELADEEFESIKEISYEKSEVTKNEVISSNLDIAIDRDSFQSYLENSNTLKRYISHLEELGFKIKRLYTESDVSISVRALKLAKLSTLQELDTILNAELDNNNFYESLRANLGEASLKERSMSKSAAVRLAIVANTDSTQQSKAVLDAMQFKQKLHKSLNDFVKKTA
ncbi:putative Region found in RelA / SpoT s family protein [Vibrio chagasii]|nr:putative Region found in RelA / SpoT s family protein [Vibrio chagasii]CAH7313322.1 putative Region found in RelA / SpoT s family protein [Vibrio chagasii]CAH7330616.1 putative Region found in RelA / SpoT s family protein [Vibrio chagasii]